MNAAEVSDRSTLLGQFLRERRAQIPPEKVGLPGHERGRRVTGLRREEVASLVSISTDHYMRLEQGRRTASPPVLEALAGVLQLDPDERRYLFEMSGKSAQRTPPKAARTASVSLRQVLFELSCPAIILGDLLDVLAWNSAAAALLTDFEAVRPHHRNFARIMFTDPSMRQLHADWPAEARACVAMLRMGASQHQHDPHLAALVGHLSVTDDDFRRWWADHHVTGLRGGAKTYLHPRVGQLTLRWDSLTLESESSQRLIVWTAEPGTQDATKLNTLANIEASTSNCD